MHDKTPQIEWRDGDIPISTRFDDPYFSLDNGLAETEHVFLAGNDLHNRFAHDLHIAELGFGTGLNFLATWRAWAATPDRGTLHYSAFEAFPMSQQEMARALAAFPTLSDVATPLIANWPNPEFSPTPGLTLSLIFQDARSALPLWPQKADAWFLDGFSPAKNPELWEPSLMHAVAGHTAPGGTFATYTAAGFVRRALGDAGFTVSRIPGFGRKRHMSVGHLTAQSDSQT